MGGDARCPPGPPCSTLTLSKLLAPQRAGKAAPEAEPFGSAWRVFLAQPTAMVGAEQGKEIPLRLAEPTLGVAVVRGSAAWGESSFVPSGAAPSGVPHAPESIPDDKRGYSQQRHLGSC